jgi:transcriptional regulator with XRE-family HTH domain
MASTLQRAMIMKAPCADLRYHACMSPQDGPSFAETLRQALTRRHMRQVQLARLLNVDPSQVNRWVNGNAVPHIGTVGRIEQILETNLSDSFTRSTPDYELFVSAPISGIASEEIPAHHEAVAKVVAAASQHVNNLVWPGERIRTAADRRAAAADIVTERNMQDLYGCPAYLYLQFAEVIGPTSSFVELGFALGRKMKITIIVQRGLTTPYMLHGFGAVSATLKFLPKARIYDVETAEDAASLIAGNGRELLGLT